MCSDNETDMDVKGIYGFMNETQFIYLLTDSIIHNYVNYYYINCIYFIITENYKLRLIFLLIEGLVWSSMILLI